MQKRGFTGSGFSGEKDIFVRMMNKFGRDLKWCIFGHDEVWWSGRNELQKT